MNIDGEEEYAKFVESMAEFCNCSPAYRPCDGVLAGGPCDEIEAQPFFDEEAET
jgi:hypothetical protein